MSVEHREKIRSAHLAKPIKTEKYCPRCQEIKPASEYDLRKTDYGRQLRSYCKPCHKTYALARLKQYQSKPENQTKLKKWNRKATLKRNHGITPADFQVLFARQNGKCAICGSHDPGKGHTNLAVDHCHKTGVIRGLLCHTCNRSIGLLRDDIGYITRALNYLQEPPCADIGLTSVRSKKPRHGVAPITVEQAVAA